MKLTNHLWFIIIRSKLFSVGLTAPPPYSRATALSMAPNTQLLGRLGSTLFTLRLKFTNGTISNITMERAHVN